MHTEAISTFWKSWPTLRPLIEKELAAGEYGEGTGTLTDAIEAIDPQLEWELMEARRPRMPLPCHRPPNPAYVMSPRPGLTLPQMPMGPGSTIRPGLRLVRRAWNSTA